MAQLSFEMACFESTLRTMKLKPQAILLNDQRTPANVNDPLLRMARPTWIGKDYGPGGVLLLAKNPAGGSIRHHSVAHSADAKFAAALIRLDEQQDIASYRDWRDDAQPEAMKTWSIWKNSATAILTALGLSSSNIAFGNFVPFRTKDNKVKSDEFSRGWELDIRHLVALLKPTLIVKMTAEFADFHQRCRDVNILQFRRANGDGFITDAGNVDLAVIRKWAESHYYRSTG